MLIGYVAGQTYLKDLLTGCHQRLDTQINMMVSVERKGNANISIYGVDPKSQLCERSQL